MDWYDTAGDGWLETAFGDVNADGYFDATPADTGLDPYFDSLGIDGLGAFEPEVPVVDDAASSPADEITWPAGDLTDTRPIDELVDHSSVSSGTDFPTADSVPAGGSVWTLARPW